jgi:hypothetical protein
VQVRSYISSFRTHREDNLSNFAHKLWQRGRNQIPVRSFVFDRPLVLLQSDDWGRVGVRDHDGFDQLRSAGVNLGKHPYDLYTLETAEDVYSLIETLQKHRDSSGRPACLEMNFSLANVDFPRTVADDFRRIHLRPLSEGLPGKWSRPGLLEAYAHGIAEGVFYPALHGLTHFCRPAVEACLSRRSNRGDLLRTLWQAETPYIHWRMPWIGYEYWHPERPSDERFLAAGMQHRLIKEAAAIFRKLFAMAPFSACAPGYRANDDTLFAWAEQGIRVTQNGTGGISAVRLDASGMLQLFRTIDFEPVVDSSFSVDDCLRTAKECIWRGTPVVVSVHSINFHSTLKHFRSATLQLLHQFLSALERSYPNLLYVHDEDLWQIVDRGSYEHEGGTIAVSAKQQSVAREVSAAERSA